MREKMRKTFLSTFMVLLLVFTLSSSSFAATINISPSADNSEITVAYNYPVKPGSEAWSKFKTRFEKIEACQIPDSILSCMTTKALFETVMNYPLLIDMVVRDSKLEGYNAILRVFNGLQELVKRPDYTVVLKEYQSALSKNLSLSKEVVLKKSYIEYIAEGLLGTLDKSSIIMYSTGTVYTPHGTAVSTIYNLTWADHGISSTTADYYDDQLQLTYPNAVHLREEYPSYNCHSYAWYSTSSTNKHWINNPSAYMTDGSYSSGSASSGSKVYYGSTANHSGRVVYVGGMYDIGVYSKWGYCGLYSHNIFDCPYTEGSYTCTFWNLT